MRPERGLSEAGRAKTMSKKKKKEKEEEPKEVKVKKTVKSKVISEEKPVSEEKAPEKPTAAAAPKPKKAAAKTVKKKPVVVEITYEEISLRAYFIAENRNKLGLPGSEHDDWVEAERQLREGKTK